MSANKGENVSHNDNEKSTVIITRGLRKFCKTNIVFEQIQKEVLNFSAIYQEMPILLSYILYTCAKNHNRNFFLQSILDGALFEYFFNLIYNSAEFPDEKQCVQFHIDSEIIKNYRILRGKYNLPVCVHSPLIPRQCKKYANIYQTLFKLYIEEKIKKWLTVFLISHHPGIRLNDIIGNIFRTSSLPLHHIMEKKILTTMKEKLGFCSDSHQLYKTDGWFSCLPILFRLQELQIIDKSVSNVIQIIPMVKPGRVFISMDTLDLYEMCFKLNVLKKGDNIFSKTSLPKIWHSNFNFTKFNNKTKRNRIIPELKTNGITCEFEMVVTGTCKEKTKTKSLLPSTIPLPLLSLHQEETQNAANSNPSIKNNIIDWQYIWQTPQTLRSSKYEIPRKYQRIIGCDIGSKILFSTMELDAESKALTWHTYKTSTYFHMSGIHWKFYKLNKLTEKISKEIKIDNNMAHAEYPNPINIEIYIKNALSNFNKIFIAYTRKAIARCEYQAYITKQEYDIKFIEQLTNGFQKTLFFVGNITDKPTDNILEKFNLIVPDKGMANEFNSWRKISNIILQFLKKLQDFCDIVFVDEFKTTKLCNYCMEEQILSKLPHRFAFCAKCKITRHRDINAAANILHLGLRQVQGKEKLQQFSRTP